MISRKILLHLCSHNLDEGKRQSAPINTPHTPSARFTRFLRREEEPDSRRSTPTMTGCDEPVKDSNGAKDPSEQTEGQPDVVPVIESNSHSDQRFTATRQEVLTLINMLERIPRVFFHIDGVQTSRRLSLNVVTKPPLFPVRHAPSTSQEDVLETTQEGSGTQSEGENQTAPRGKRRRPRNSMTTAMLRKHPVLQYGRSVLQSNFNKVQQNCVLRTPDLGIYTHIGMTRNKMICFY